jgi:hypothetical protein
MAFVWFKQNGVELFNGDGRTLLYDLTSANFAGGWKRTPISGWMHEPRRVFLSDRHAERSYQGHEKKPGWRHHAAAVQEERRRKAAAKPVSATGIASATAENHRHRSPSRPLAKAGKALSVW